ncbi:MAG: hypothetical protein D9V47_08600 [Clostridia bacterium]|nr:MAG: hypothetical protein D9V47_08600 [Clostridia bacterium]
MSAKVRMAIPWLLALITLLLMFDFWTWDNDAFFVWSFAPWAYFWYFVPYASISYLAIAVLLKLAWPEPPQSMIEGRAKRGD